VPGDDAVNCGETHEHDSFLIQVGQIAPAHFVKLPRLRCKSRPGTEHENLTYSQVPLAPNPSSSPPSASPIVPAVPPQFAFYLLLIWFASVSALDPSPLPIAPSARGSSACEPRLTWCASLWWNYSRRPACQERKEPRQHAEARSPNSFSPPSTSTQSPLVPLDLP